MLNTLTQTKESKNMNEKIILVSIINIAAHPAQSEIYGKTTVDKEFVDSIRERGVLQPVILTETANSPLLESSDKLFTLISGHRRLLGTTEAGLDQIPAIEKTYTTVDETIVDLIVSNKTRTKTKAQILKEIDTLSQKLCQIAKSRQANGINGDNQIPDLSFSPIGENAANGLSAIAENMNFMADKPLNSSKEIAEQLGLSKKNVEKLQALGSFAYRDKAYERIAKANNTNTSSPIIYKLDEEWDAITDKYKSEELSLDAAYNQIMKLQKDAKPKSKKKSEKKEQKKKDSVNFKLVKIAMGESLDYDAGMKLFERENLDVFAAPHGFVKCVRNGDECVVVDLGLVLETIVNAQL